MTITCMQESYLYVTMAMSHLTSESSWFKDKLIKGCTERLLGVVCCEDKVCSPGFVRHFIETIEVTVTVTSC